MFKLLLVRYHIFVGKDVHINLQKYHLNKASKITERKRPIGELNTMERVLCSLHLTACDLNNKRADAHIQKAGKILNSIKE